MLRISIAIHLADTLIFSAITCDQPPGAQPKSNIKDDLVIKLYFRLAAKAYSLLLIYTPLFLPFGPSIHQMTFQINLISRISTSLTPPGVEASTTSPTSFFSKDLAIGVVNEIVFFFNVCFRFTNNLVSIFFVCF